MVEPVRRRMHYSEYRYSSGQAKHAIQAFRSESRPVQTLAVQMIADLPSIGRWRDF